MKRLKLTRKQGTMKTNEVERAYEQYERKHTKTTKNNWFETLKKEWDVK